MSDYDQIDFRAPLALRKLLVDFSLHCLYYRPDNLYQFAAYYFQRQVDSQQARKTSGKHDSSSSAWIKSPFDYSNKSTTTSDNQSAINIDKPIWRQGSTDNTNGDQDDNLMWIFHCFVHKDSKQAFYDVMYDSIFNHEFTMAHSMNGFVSSKMKGIPFNRSTRAIYHGCFPMPTNIHGLTPIERNEEDDSRSFSVDFDFGPLQHRNRIIDNYTGSTDEKNEEVIMSNSTDKSSKETYQANSKRNGKEKSSLNKLNDQVMIDQDQLATTQHRSAIDVSPKVNPLQSFHEIGNQDHIEIHVEHHQNNNINDNQGHDNGSLNSSPNTSNRQQNKGESGRAVKVGINNSIQPIAARECIDGVRNYSKINDLGGSHNISNTVTDRIPSVIDKEKVLTYNPIKKEDESLAAKDDLPINSDSKIRDKDVVMTRLNNSTAVEIDEQREKSHFSQSEKQIKNHSQRGNSTLNNNNYSQQTFSKGSHAGDKTVRQDGKKTKISRSVVSQSHNKDLDERKEGASAKSAGILGQKGRENHSSPVIYSKLGKTKTDQAMRNTVLHGNNKKISHDRRKDMKDSGSVKYLNKKDQDKNQEKKSTGIPPHTHKEKSNSSQNYHPRLHDNLLKQTLNKTRHTNRNPTNSVISKKLKTKGSVNRLDKKDQDKSHGIKSINTPGHTRKDNSSNIPQGSNPTLDKNHLDQTVSKTAGVSNKVVKQDESQEVDANSPVDCLDGKDGDRNSGKNSSSISEHTCKDSVNLSYSKNPIPDENQTIRITSETNQKSNKQLDNNGSVNYLHKIDQDQSHGIRSTSILQHTCKDDDNLFEGRENANDFEAIDPVQDKSSTDQTLSQIYHVDNKTENRDSSKEMITNQSSVKKMYFSNQDKCEDRTTLTTIAILSKTDRENNHFLRVDPAANKTNTESTIYVSNEIDNQDKSKLTGLCQCIAKSQDHVKERPTVKSSTSLCQTDEVSKDASQIVDLAMDKKSTGQNSSRIVHVDNKIEDRDSSKEIVINKAVATPISELDKKIQEVGEEKKKAILSSIVTMTDKQSSNDGVKPGMDKNSPGQVDSKTKNLDSSQEMIIKSIGSPISDLDKKNQEEDEEKTTAVSSTILSMADEKNTATHTVNLEMDKKNPSHVDSKMENLNSSKEIINNSVASLISALHRNIQDKGEERTKSIHGVTGEKNNTHSHQVEPAIYKNGPGHIDSKIENLDSCKEMVINKSVVHPISELDKKIQKKSEERRKAILSATANITNKQVNNISHGVNPVMDKDSPDHTDSKIDSLDNCKEVINMSVVNPLSEQDKKIQDESEEKMKAESFVISGITDERDNYDSHIVNPTMNKSSLGQALSERSHIDKKIENRDTSKELKIKHLISMPVTQPEKKMQEEGIETTKAISSVKLKMTDKKNSHHFQGVNSTLNNSNPNHVDSKTKNQQCTKELKNNRSAVTQLDNKNQRESQEGTKAKWGAFQWHKVYAKLMKQKQVNSLLESSSTSTTINPPMQGQANIAKDQDRDNSFDGVKKDAITYRHTDLRKEGKRGDPIVLIQRDSELKSDPISYLKNSSNINENHNRIESENSENITGKLQVVVPSNYLSSLNDDKDDPIQIEKSSQENDDEESCDIAIGRNANCRENDVIHDRQHSMLQTTSKKSIHKDDEDESDDKAAIRRTGEVGDNDNDNLHTTDELRMHTSKPDLLSHPTNQVNLAKSNSISKVTISRHDVKAYILQRMNELGKSSKKHHSNRKDPSTANDTTDDHLANKCKPKLFKKRLPQPSDSSSQQDHDSPDPAVNMPMKLSGMSWQPLALPTHHSNSSDDRKILKKELQEKNDIEEAYQGIIPVKNFHHPMARNYRSMSDTCVHGSIIPLLSKNISQPATSEIVEKVSSYSQMLHNIKKKLTKVEDSANVDRLIARKLDAAKDSTNEQNGSDDEKDEIQHESKMHQTITTSLPNDIHSHEINEHTSDRTIAAYDLAIMDDGRHRLASPALRQHLQFPLEPQVHQQLASKVDENRLQHIDAFNINTIHKTGAHPVNVAGQKRIQSTLINPSSTSLASKSTENQLLETQHHDAIMNQPECKVSDSQQDTATSLAGQQQIQSPLIHEGNASLTSKITNNQKQETQHYDAIKNQVELNVIHASNSQHHPVSLSDQRQRPSPLIHRSNANLASKTTENPLPKTQHHSAIKNQPKLNIMPIGDNQHHPANLAGQQQIQSLLIHQASKDIVNKIDTNLLQESEQFDALHNQPDLKKNLTIDISMKTPKLASTSLQVGDKQILTTNVINKEIQKLDNMESDCDGSDVGLNPKLQSRHLDTLPQKDTIPSQDTTVDSSHHDLQLEAVNENCPYEKEHSNIPNSNIDFMVENHSGNDVVQQSISSPGIITNDGNDQRISTPISSKQELRNIDVNQSENIYHSEINLLERKKNSTNDGIFSMVDDVNNLQAKNPSNSLKRQVMEGNNDDICFSNNDTGKLQLSNQEMDDHSSSLKSQFMDDNNDIISISIANTESIKSLHQEMDDKVEDSPAKNTEKKRHHHRSSKRKGDKKHKKNRKAKSSHSRSKRGNTLDSIMEEEEENEEQESQPIHYHVEPNHEVAKLIGKLICNQDIDEDDDADQDIETIVYDEEIFYPLITTLVHKYEDIVENKLDHLSQQDQEIIQEQYQSLKELLTTADKCWSAYHNGSDFEVLENIRQLKSSLMELIEENYIHEDGLTILASAIGESRVPKTCTIL